MNTYIFYVLDDNLKMWDITNYDRNQFWSELSGAESKVSLRSLIPPSLFKSKNAEIYIIESYYEFADVLQNLKNEPESFLNEVRQEGRLIFKR